MKNLKSVKISFIYIGTLVGAGFATGQEIQLYFGESDVLTLILAGLVTGIFCIFMLLAGKQKLLGEKSKKLLDLIFSLSGMITAGIMLAGIKSIANSPFIVVISLVVCLIVAVFGNKGIKIFNFVAVPILIIAVILSGFKINGDILGAFKPTRAICYSAMNIFFESLLMYNEGQKMDNKQIVFTGLFVSLFVFVLIFFMRKATTGFVGVMPYLYSANVNKIGWLALLVVILAIYSTIINCLSISFEFFKGNIGLGSLAIIFVSSLFISVFSFDILVEKVYPIFSYLGIILNLSILLLLLRNFLKYKNNSILTHKFYRFFARKTKK